MLENEKNDNKIIGCCLITCFAMASICDPNHKRFITIYYCNRKNLVEGNEIENAER